MCLRKSRTNQIVSFEEQKVSFQNKFSLLDRYAAFLHDMKGGVSQVIILCMVRHQQCLLTALDAAAMADVQPADGSFLCHAIYGGQCHGQPPGCKEGGC